MGYSDHTIPDSSMTVMTTAYLKGAKILEKHFTRNKKLPGNDHYHAMDKKDLRNFKNKLDNYKLLLGKNFIDLKEQEHARLHARRSIFSKGNIKKGDIIKESSLIAKRPGHGISPIHWDKIIGKKLLVSIKDDTLIEWSMLN